MEYTKRELPVFHPRDSILAIQKQTFKKMAKKKNHTVKYRAFVKDGNDKMVTKEIPETWLKQFVVPKYWKLAEQFFNHPNGWVAFSKNHNTIKHFRDVRGIMKNVDEFKEVYSYSNGVSGLINTYHEVCYQN